MYILNSYKSHIGKATTNSVKASVVGVMIAETMRMATTACRRKCDIISPVMMPVLPSNAHTTGSSKTTPMTKLMPMSVSVYDWSVSMLATSGLT